MSRKISLNVSEQTDERVERIKLHYGILTATDVYARAVQILDALSEFDPDRKGLTIIVDEGEPVKLVIL